eukprot:6194157-Pleurochrysis_carterae.AAC.1
MHRPEDLPDACAEHGGYGNRKVDHGVIELFVHLIDEARGPQDDFRRGHADQFESANGTIKCGIDIETRNYVWMNAMARQADADTKWSLATAVNIR